jgi:hypothetical protein
MLAYQRDDYQTLSRHARGLQLPASLWRELKLHCDLRVCRYDVHAIASLGVAAFTNFPYAVLLQPGSSTVLRARDTLSGQEYLLPELPAAAATETAVYTDTNPVPGDSSDAPTTATTATAAAATSTAATTTTDATAAAAAAAPHVFKTAAPPPVPLLPQLDAGDGGRADDDDDAIYIEGASVATDIATAIPSARAAAAAQAAQAAARTAARAAAAAEMALVIAPQAQSNSAAAADTAATAALQLPGTATAAAAALAAAAPPPPAAAAVAPPPEPAASPELAAAALAAARRYAVYTANSEPVVLNAHAHAPVCVYEVTFPRAGTLGLNLKTLSVPCGARSRSAEHCACLEVINVQSLFLTAVVQPRDVIVSVNGQSLRGGAFGAFSFEVSLWKFNCVLH